MFHTLLYFIAAPCRTAKHMIKETRRRCRQR